MCYRVGGELQYRMCYRMVFERVIEGIDVVC